MYQLTFLRHGRSQADDEDRFEGRYDSPLTAVGVAQARELANRWKLDEARRYDRILCSTLRRAVETAQIISEAVRAPLTEDPLWMERDGGKIAGLKQDEGSRLYPLPSFVGPYDRLVEGTAESHVQLHARSYLALQNLLDLPDGRYLVVAHGGILNAALRQALGISLPVGQGGVSFRLGDLGYIDLAFERGDHRWTVLGMQ